MTDDVTDGVTGSPGSRRPRVPALLHPFAATGRDQFIRLVAGRGSSVFDDHGNEYLDAIASLWCVNVGHGRREVIDAVTQQMGALATYNTFGTWTNGPADHLAELVAARAPMDDARVFFTSSGSEAVDTAIKLARLTHVLLGDAGRSLVVSREGGYHGTAYGGTSAQGIAANRDGFGPLVEGVLHVGRHDLEEAGRIMAARGSEVAAVLAEPVQGASGVHPPQPGYLAGLRRLCDRHGALLILDEVITGFGRLGSWFAASTFDVVPDLVTFAKGVTSGYIPLGGVIVGPRVRSALESDPEMVLRTGFTSSGHPTATAAGVACIEVTEREGLLERASALEAGIAPGLEALQADGSVVAVRGQGGIWAVDLPDHGPDAAAVAAAMVADGVIVRPIGTATLALCPPLVMTPSEVDRVLDALATALGRRRASATPPEPQADGDDEVRGQAAPRREALPLTYDECRARFRRAATTAGCTVDTHLLSSQGPAGQELSIDVAALGPPSPRRALVVLSGVHGVEGFIGSALQCALLDRVASGSLPADLGVVLVHAVNPWGMAHGRRQNESNVDLNRNWGRDEGPPPHNDAYDEIHDLACPDTPTLPSVDDLLEEVGPVLALHGLEWVRDAITRGQYRHADGLHFGGHRTEESNAVLQRVVPPLLASAEKVLIVDLHTGHGPRGELTVLSDRPEGSDQHRFLEATFARVQAQSSVIGSRSRPKTGTVGRGIASTLPAATCYPATLEVGTAGDTEQLAATYQEQWVHRHGSLDQSAHRAVRRAYRDCFTPDDPEWETLALRVGGEHLGAALEAVQQWT